MYKWHRVEALKGNQTLEELELADNGIQQVAVAPVADFLQQNSSLTVSFFWVRLMVL